MAGMSSKIVSVKDDDELQYFLLCWLDTEVNIRDENQDTMKLIRSTTNNFVPFDNTLQCQQCIESLPEQSQLILIASGRLGREVLPQIHHLQQLSIVYIYCMDKKFNEEWSRDYSKVKDVIVRPDDLITRIKSHLKNPIKKEEPILFNMYSPQTDDQLSTKFNDFLHSFILINGLLQLESTTNDHQQLTCFCKKKYKGNSNQLNLIHQFKREYTPNKALWWYTRESFLYRMINEALSGKDIHLLLLFHYIIKDIYHQLKQNQYKSSIRTYYGQIMTSSEFKSFQKSGNNFIFINSFLWTNTNRNKTLHSLNNSPISMDQYRILFVIDADPHKLFANINDSSSFIEEGGVMFMLGCIFRIIEINEDEHLKTIQIQLCSDNEHELRPIFESMKRSNITGDETKPIDLTRFGDLMRQIGKYDRAENIYRFLISKLSSNDSLLSDIYCALGTNSKDQNKHDASLEYYRKALEIKMRTHSSDSTNILNLYRCIGEAYSRIENDSKASEYYKKAISRFENTHAKDHTYMADIYNNLGSIYRHKEKYPEALEYYKKALAIDEKNTLYDRPNVGKSHNNIGIVYCHLQQYDLALEHCKLSLLIKLKTLPSNHVSIGNSYRNIGWVYETIGDIHEALLSYQKAATIFHQILPSNHEDVRQIDVDIERVNKMESKTDVK